MRSGLVGKSNHWRPIYLQWILPGHSTLYVKGKSTRLNVKFNPMCLHLKSPHVWLRHICVELGLFPWLCKAMLFSSSLIALLFYKDYRCNFKDNVNYLLLIIKKGQMKWNEIDLRVWEVKRLIEEKAHHNGFEPTGSLEWWSAVTTVR